MNHAILEARLNAHVPTKGRTEPLARVRFVEEVPFGESLRIQRWKLGNGLTILFLRDPIAPVVSYQTWLRVGSSHERPGKTGQAHLLEHLMFHSTKTLAQGEFDRLLEAAGGETNAATWVDWTYYYENVPASELALAVRLEADRMANLALVKDKVASEKQVVASERRDRVEDDVEGKVGEVLYATAFGREHPYGWPTIGWMDDIDAFTPADCRAFYRTHYAPNAATLVVVGDVDPEELLSLVQQHYGTLPPSRLPIAEPPPAVRQRATRTKEVRWPTPTPKIAIGWHAPPYLSFDHAVMTVIDQLLVGGRSSRLWRELVRERELAAEVRMSVAPFRHSSLVDLWLSAREGQSIDKCVAVADKHLRRLQKELVPEIELEKVKNRLELGFLGSLETVSGKADQIGFCETVAGDPQHTFTRLAEYRRVTPEDVRRVAREVFDDRRRTVVRVVPRRTPARSPARSPRAKPGGAAA
ncbi:MAG: insulinase family protein [Myxococcota bacterium]|nr:insulinase family protein [Myxococcota bacterium]